MCYLCHKNNMNEDDNILYFLSFCVEKYKSTHGMDGETVASLFSQKGVFDYLKNHYDVLHTQSADWIVTDIDEYLTH